MKLITGLGNPGRRYKKTRHNIGFITIDELKKHVSKKDAIFLKPSTYMNNSGKEVKSVIKNNNLSIINDQLIVIHDDIDLPFGIIRVSRNASAAGHKGVQSIINEIDTQNFTRVRIGIKPKSEIRSTKSETANFVLEKFTKHENKQLKNIIKEAVSKVKQLL